MTGRKKIAKKKQPAVTKFGLSLYGRPTATPEADSTNTPGQKILKPTPLIVPIPVIPESGAPAINPST